MKTDHLSTTSILAVQKMRILIPMLGAALTPKDAVEIAEIIDVEISKASLPKEGLLNSTVLPAVIAELHRATSVYPGWPTDPLHAFAIVNEECGELQREILQMTYESYKSSKATVQAEAIQLAAMTFRFLLSLENYEYNQSNQHIQAS